MAHPVRSKLLMILADAGDPLTVKQLVEKAAEPERKVRYHLEALLREGLVAVVGGTRRRGVVERSFRAKHEPITTPEMIARLPAEEVQKIIFNIMRFTLVETGAALAARTFWRPGFLQTRHLGWVDQRGWEELAAIHKRTMSEVEAAIEKSKGRAGSAAERPVQALSAQLLFQLP